ncbi:MAG: helix-hairpin-helix domain-containing protein [Spirochaetes bacterium]|nr:helix-hairpin-helix domain-containing protein [Spirochaetota bacterium]
MTIFYNNWKRILWLVFFLILGISIDFIVPRRGFLKEFVRMDWLFDKHRKKDNSLSSKGKELIKVRISGSVRQKGIMVVEKGTTLISLAKKCGLKQEADTQSLPSIVLEDGKDYHIPYKKVETDQRININTADAGEIERIPLMTERMAKEIVEYRKKYGKIDRLEEIMQISGIGNKKFRFFKKYLTTGE